MNIHVSPEQICCSYHNFLIVLDFLGSHHACVLYISYKMPYQFHLCKYHHNVNAEFHKLFLAVFSNRFEEFLYILVCTKTLQTIKQILPHLEDPIEPKQQHEHEHEQRFQ